ncbi:MAG: radical SAM family heme chaperone HemW [Anaerolineaceae bacterium]|nr:radical SAM family heme chaperone HemW [Anaerolineaceae bacterium]
MDVYSLYLHIPFCIHRCSYCDFNTYAGQESQIPAYIEALCREIELIGQSTDQRLPVHTIFFGGGTPSLLPVTSLAKVLKTIANCFDLLPDLETSLEANPGTVSADSLRGMREIGFNRLSFGMQSAHPDDLRLLERQHDTIDVIQAVKWARQAGFDNLNLDLIFGLPFQTLERWQQSLDLAVGMGVEHLSLYSLTLEHGTPFLCWAEKGLIPFPDDDLAADMYDWACDRLSAAGFQQYEISNWARPAPNNISRACRHNLQYWHNAPYFGFGAGAHGYVQGVRTANVLGIKAFIQRCLAAQSCQFPIGPAAAQVQQIDRWTEMQETMMVGLRLTDEGVSAQTFLARFGETLNDMFGEVIGSLIKVNLVEWAGPAGDCLRLTQHGKLLGNYVFRQFVGEDVKPEHAYNPNHLR